MKNKLLTIVLLVALPLLSFRSSPDKDKADGKDFAIVCVDWALFGAGPNTVYFYTRACAQTVQANYPGSTLVKNAGGYCVNETMVFVCP